MVFGADTPFEGDLANTCREFRDRTCDHWQEWIRRLGISFEWQDAVIRAAITLKLSAFEETGAIIAAHTTSIHERRVGTHLGLSVLLAARCLFVVRDLNRIGATRTMENYINYILTIVSGQTGELQPVYSIVSTDPLEERIVADLKGYRGDGPVRIGNAAVAQNQHDTYGSAILAATPMFFDRRLPRMGDENLFRRLGRSAKSGRTGIRAGRGIWEYRGRKRIHTHSVAMCWAGCQRLEAIAAHLGLDDRAAYWASTRPGFIAKCWRRPGIPSARRSRPRSGRTISMQACCALRTRRRGASDPRFVSTVNAIERELKRDLNVMRYTRPTISDYPRRRF